MSSYILNRVKQIKYLYHMFIEAFHRNPGKAWHQLLFIAFWLSIAFFPIGYGYREVMPLLCLVFLAMFYKYCWKSSVLRRLGPKWLFICPLIMIGIGILFSIHPLQSLFHAGTGINKAFILPFIAMECVRNLKDLRRLTFAFVVACFWQGLDGIWQAILGQDFIMGYKPNNGRLTGSLGDYTVGNYIALALIPATGCWFILKERFKKPLLYFLIFLLFFPPVFLLIGASARSGILALAASFFLWFVMSQKKLSLGLIIWPGIIIGGFMIFQPDRLTVDAVSSDNRWDLWYLGWQVFKAHPWLGAGAGQYNAAFRELNLAPQNEVITISHPHNLYLDILYAHGLTGFVLGMIFLFGFFFWCYKKIIFPLRQKNASPSIKLYWQLTAWMFLGYAGWLVNGIFGHDFYRIWWLAMAMCSLGITLGAIVNAPEK